MCRMSGMKRYAIITKVEIYAGDEDVGVVEMDDNIGYKATLSDIFMSGKDIAFVGKVLEFIEDNGDLDIEEEI